MHSDYRNLIASPSDILKPQALISAHRFENYILY